MRFLGINPSFLDYRVPLYNELNKLLNGNFFIIYSKKRIPERVDKKVKYELKNNAKGLLNEKNINIGNIGDFANQGVSIPYQRKLLQTIFSIRAEIIISEGFFQWTPFAVFYSVLKRKPLWIVYERTTHTERFCPKWRELYRKFVNLFVTGYLVNGVLTENYLNQLGITNKTIIKGCMSADSSGLAKKVKMVSEFEKSSFEKHLKLKVGLTFLFVGQIIERKGVKEMIEAWLIHLQKHPKDNLILVGGGSQLEELSNKYSLEKSINFIGTVDYDIIHKYYSIADIFILPTLEDNWSLVVPEAMACGLPIATSIYNGCHPELVKKGVNGHVFDPLNKLSLIDSFKYFHDSKNELIKMGHESIIIESEYSPVLTALRIFNGIIGNKN